MVLWVHAASAQSPPPPLSPAFDSAAIAWPDSLSNAAPTDSSAGALASGEIKVVRRQYKYREQVRLALFMMAFVALALTASQTWNPD